MLIFSISLPDPYFMDTSERRVWGWKEAQRQGDFTNNFSIYTYTSQNIYTGHVSVNVKQYIHCNRISVSVKTFDM
jgi:hypothetical protein